MIPRVAFIHYPHAAESARLDTMPFAMNAVTMLADTGLMIDLYLWEKDVDRYRAVLPTNVRVLTSGAFSHGLEGRLGFLRRTLGRLQIARAQGYVCTFGLGQIGSHVASVIARANGCPWVYFNDEFPSNGGDGVLARLEREAVRKAALVVIPDVCRFSTLCEEIGIDPAATPYVVLPNAARIREPLLSIDWHRRLGLPSDSIPLLNAGSVADWSQIPELLCTVPYWPERAVLILQSRSPLPDYYVRGMSHLLVPGRVFLNAMPISEEELNSLVSYCVGNFALYRNYGPNIDLMGFSSGKLMRSIVCGSPVIASKFSSLAFVEESKCGVLVNHPSEIPAAIIELIAHHQEYRKRCIRFASEQLSFDQVRDSFYAALSDIPNLSPVFGLKIAPLSPSTGINQAPSLPYKARRER